MERKKILITGGAGFVGYHLARHLLSTSTAKLVLVDNLFRGRMDAELKTVLKNSRVTFLNLDLTDPRAYLRLGSQYDHVYHLAAVNGTGIFYDMPHEVMRINTATILLFLEWFRKRMLAARFFSRLQTKRMREGSPRLASCRSQRQKMCRS